MEIKKGQKVDNRIKKTAIIEFVLKNHTIYVFQGSLSTFDILIKYNKEEGKLRTPKHIHWVVDVLMKLQGNHKLTRSFVRLIKKEWKKAKPLTNNDYETLKEIIMNSIENVNIDKFISLEKYGEFDCEFLFVLTELLAIQEKTNRPDAYLFGEIIDQLLQKELDIFKIVSTTQLKGGQK